MSTMSLLNFQVKTNKIGKLISATCTRKLRKHFNRKTYFMLPTNRKNLKKLYQNQNFMYLS